MPEAEFLQSVQKLVVTIIAWELLGVTPMSAAIEFVHNATALSYFFRGVYAVVCAMTIVGVKKNHPKLLLPFLIYEAFFVVYAQFCFIPLLHQIPPNTVFVHYATYYNGIDHANELVMETVKQLHEKILRDMTITTLIHLVCGGLNWLIVFIAYCALMWETIFLADTSTDTPMNSNNDDNGGTMASSGSEGGSTDGEAPVVTCAMSVANATSKESTGPN